MNSCFWRSLSRNATTGAIREHFDAAAAGANRRRPVRRLLAVAKDVAVQCPYNVGREILHVESPVPDDGRVEGAALPLGDEPAQQRPDVALDAGAPGPHRRG